MPHLFELDDHALSVTRAVTAQMDGDSSERAAFLIAGYQFMIDARVVRDGIPIYPTPEEVLDYLTSASQDIAR